MFGGLLFLIALLVVLVVGAAGIRALWVTNGRGHPAIRVDRRRNRGGG